ncbi:MAG: autotransporter-associated beta strand repeat-containing protein, partial [Kiritimatiellae bacterium]|nr:autotransporter-associated beta strand repeat-containing protein [Kiritimatiellia bacterium]
PLRANWLTDANWDQGAWDETSTANKAVFGASSQTAVDVNGDVTAASVSVDGADYTFGGAGTLEVNGSFNVGAGRTVTVNGPLAQTASTQADRLVKTGDGTLDLRGAANDFYRMSLHGGKLKFNGGTHVVSGSYTSSSPHTEPNVVLSLAKGTFVIEGGARVSVPQVTTYISNSGADMFVTNGTFDVWNVGEFLNCFNDTNVEKSDNSSLTIQDEGEVIVKKLRISKITSHKDGYGLINLNAGGRLVFRQLVMDEGSGRQYYGRMYFDGGTLVTTNTPTDKSDKVRVERFGKGDIQSNQSWKNVHLYIKEGGLTIDNQGDCDSFFYKAFESGAAHDGGITLTGKHCAYLYATNSYNGGTVVTGSSYCAVNSDRSLGAVPAEPTDNVFMRSGNAYFYFGGNVDLHPNRRLRLVDGSYTKIGTADGKVGRIRGQILGAGEADDRSMFLCANAWSGTTALAPVEGVTNRIGKLRVQGVLRVDSGTTLLTTNSLSNVNELCPLYVDGGTAFSDTKGKLIVAGGILKVVNDCYCQISSFGQLVVTNGVLDLSDARELLNGISGTGRTTVSDKGQIWCKILRISQSDKIDSGGMPTTEVNVRTGGVVRLQRYYIDTYTTAVVMKGLLNLDGGVSVATMNTVDFLGNDHWKWTNIFARACAGGAIFDSNGHNISIKNPIYSGAEEDGGLTKRGTGTLTMVNTNTYNGVTRLEGGTLAFSHAEGYPGGDLEIAAAAVQGQTLAAPLLTAQAVAFREGKGVRVTEADTLDDKTFGRMKTVATFTTPLAAVPSLTLVNTDGTEWTSSKQWCLLLADGGKTLQFGALRGTQVIVR